EMALEEAERWPDLISIVRQEVKPERNKLKDNADGRRRKQYWWQWGRRTPALDAALNDLTRCLVISRHTKHLVWSCQPTDRVLSEATVAVSLEAMAAFSTL